MSCGQHVIWGDPWSVIRGPWSVFYNIPYWIAKSPDPFSPSGWRQSRRAWVWLRQTSPDPDQQRSKPHIRKVRWISIRKLKAQADAERMGLCTKQKCYKCIRSCCFLVCGSFLILMAITVASDSGKRTIRQFREGIDCSDAESLAYLREVVRAVWYKFYLYFYCIVLL